jgi:hypothetical protein
MTTITTQMTEIPRLVAEKSYSDGSALARRRSGLLRRSSLPRRSAMIVKPVALLASGAFFGSFREPRYPKRDW